MSLAGCDGTATSSGQDEAAMSPAAEELDALAVETGALPDRVETDPAGRYGRRYEGGSDSFCLIPDGGARGRYRFGAETRIGQEEYCRGTGRTRLTADKLMLHFDGAGKDCMIVARYEGDKIVFPGGLDLRCAALCSSRGSFAGVSFPRIDRDIVAARQMRDMRRNQLCR
jgi:hypothetical protein